MHPNRRRELHKPRPKFPPRQFAQLRSQLRGPQDARDDTQGDQSSRHYSSKVVGPQIWRPETAGSLHAAKNSAPARRVAEAVRACGGVDAFLQHLDLVAGIRAPESAG